MKQDRIIVDANEMESRIEIKGVHSMENNKNMQGSQNSCNLIQMNEESMQQLNDQSQSESSISGQRKSHNTFVSSILLDKQAGYPRNKQTRISNVNQNLNQQSNKNISNLPSPNSKTIEYQQMESNNMFLQQQSLTALDRVPSNQINQSFRNNQQIACNEEIEVESGMKQKSFIQASQQLGNSAQQGEGIELLKQKLLEARGESYANKGLGLKQFQNVLFINRVKKRFLSFLSRDRYKQIEQFHLELINDVAAQECNDGESKVSKEERKLKRLSGEQFNEYKPNPIVFSPDNMLFILWNILLFFILLFLIVTTPLLRCFNTSYQDHFMLDVLQRYISVIILIVDIILSFNKGYYDEGMVITNRIKIIKNYCKMKLFFDLFNVICCLLFEEISIVLIFIVSVCRLVSCSKIWAEVDEYLEISHKYTTTSQLVELVMLIFLIAHLCACGFFYVSKLDYENGVNPTWITYQKIELSDWQVQYIYSIYFEFITMTTIGYGDIFPCSQNERLYVIFMTLVSCAVFGYSLNAIGQIFRDISQQLSSLKQTKYDISKYLKSRNITKRVQLKIFKYLEYLNRQESEGHFFVKGEKILNRVSQNLREEVYREYYGRILSQINFLTKNFSKCFLSELSLHMKELILAPSDYLFKEGSQDNSLFFLSKGVLELYGAHSTKNDKFIEKILHRYQGGDLIGHQEFLSDQTRQWSARSLSISHLVYIRKMDFLAILERFPLDYENFCTLRDDLIFKEKDRFSICESCKQAGHSLLQCKLIFSKHNKLQIIKKFTYSEDQQRKKNVPLNGKFEEQNTISKEMKQIDNNDFLELVRKLNFKKRWDLTRVRKDLKQFRREFINEAIRKNNRKNNQTGIDEEDDSEDSIQHIGNLPSSNIEASNYAVAHTQYGMISGVSLRQKTNSYAQQDSMTFKSYTTKLANNSDYSVNENDRQFYKKYPKIHYEDNQYLILSSSQHSSSEAEVEDEDIDDEQIYDELQVYYGDVNDRYRTDDEYYFSDARKGTINEQQARHLTVKRNTQNRPGTGILPNIASPSNKLSSVINTMDTSIQIHGFQLDNPNPTFLTNRMVGAQISSQNSSSMNSLPFSQLSAIQQYQHQNSNHSSTSPNMVALGSATNIPLPNPTINNIQPQTQLSIPQGSSINQLIIKNNYFDSSDFLEDAPSQNNMNNINNNQIGENKKQTIILPTVDEASEQNEISQYEMTNSFSNQLSSSPLIRKQNREQSRRHHSKKLSSNTLPRQDSLQSINNDIFSIRRKSTRNDSTNTNKIMRDSGKTQTRKVSYMDPSGMMRDQIVITNYGSNPGSTLQNTLSKSHSRSSRHILTNQFERSRSRQSQGTLLNNNNHLAMYIYSFDKMKEYKFYYPHNNISSVIKQRIKITKRKKLQKGKKVNYSSSNVGFLLKSANFGRAILIK